MSGVLVVLNGAPRSGKSSIASEIQATFPGIWLNLGVDAWSQGVQPARIMPGIGLRPGEKNMEIEALLPRLYLGLYQSAAAHCQLGFNVVMDLGHHDSYSESLGILPACAAVACGVCSFLVGVTCPIDEIVHRRRAGASEGRAYESAEPGEEVPRPVLLWQEEVHNPGIYDLILDAGKYPASRCAKEIKKLIEGGQEPQAFKVLAEQFWDGD